MRAIGGKRSVRRALYRPYLGIMLSHTGKNGVEVIDLDAEMVDTTGITWRPSKKSEPDISVAHDDRSLVGPDDAFRSQNRGPEHFGVKLIGRLSLGRKSK